MNLFLKFNLILITTSALGLLVAGFVSYDLLQQNAREEVLEKAAVLMESAMAVRSYTIDEIRPLLHKLPEEGFISQTVPAYAAAWYVRKLQENYPNYSYKESVLNPTNPANRSTEWETGIVEWFRNHETETELVGERPMPAGPAFYFSRPIRINNQACLACHSTPAIAPKSLVERYGPSNGFGWQMNEIIGAQIVTVPKSLSFRRASKEFFTFMGALLGVFFVVGIVTNLLLRWFVILPVTHIADHADKVSLGTLELPELDAKGKDEISSLAHSFNRMQRSLNNALKMLND